VTPVPRSWVPSTPTNEYLPGGVAPEGRISGSD